jgi:hypothetical protein
MLKRSRRPPLFALAAAIALLAGLAAGDAFVGDGSRTQHLRAADPTAIVSTSLRARSVTVRRDRVELDSHAAVVTASFTLVSPHRAAVDSSLAGPAACGPLRHALPPRSRGPPRS